MFKEITAISKNYAIVKIDNVINDDLLNLNVIFEENNKKILGEIEEIINSEAKITFLGEFINDKFFDGIIRKPSINAKIRIINGNELAELTGYNDSTAMMLGLSPLYNNSPVKINIDDMWSNHTAIFGNTGSGKTYGVARLVQNLFTMPNYIPFNSVIFIFNNTDEYDNAFKSINSYNFNFNYKMFSTDTDSNNSILKLPLWLMSVDDYANLLDISAYSQIMVIEKMLNYVSLFARNDEESNKYKNHLIATAITSVLYSNQVSARIRDQIFSILTSCSTKELNLDVVCDRIKKGFALGKYYGLVILAEGVGHYEEFCDVIEKYSGVTTRGTNLGYIQRGGSPSAFDRMLASKMGAMAVECLKDGKTNRCMCYQHGRFLDMEIEEALSMPYSIDEEAKRIAEMIAI